MVPKAGLEPARVLPHTALNRARLPIPPLRQGARFYGLEVLKASANLSNSPSCVRARESVARSVLQGNRRVGAVSVVGWSHPVTGFGVTAGGIVSGGFANRGRFRGRGIFFQ